MSVTRKNHLDGLALSLLLACCLFWGFQQVLVKATVPQMAPVFQAWLRFALAAALLWAWCRWRGVALFQRDGALGWGLLAGALFAGEFVCIYVGLQHTTASRLTVFLYTSPFWVALILPRFLPTERLRRVQWVGLVKQLFYQTALSVALLPLVSWALGEHWAWPPSTFALGSVVIQAAVGAFASYLTWMWVLGHYPATKVSAFVFLTPVFALAVGAGWLGEPVTPGLIGALALVGTGIVLVNRR